MQQLISGLGRIIVEDSRSHAHPVGPRWTSGQLVAEAATYTAYKKHNRRTSHQRDSNPRF